MLRQSGQGKEVGVKREVWAWYRRRDDGAGIGGRGADGESGEKLKEVREKLVITVGYVLEYGGFCG